jgi:hypothetical protein
MFSSLGHMPTPTGVFPPTIIRYVKNFPNKQPEVYFSSKEVITKKFEIA